MKNKRIIKLIPYIILFFMVFQMIPSYSAYTVSFESHAQSSKEFLISGTFHSDVLFISRSNQKSAVQKLQVKNNLLFIPQGYAENISEIVLSFKEKQYDKRNVIRQSIPKYFNGGKYKENTSLSKI